jgi:hypothetical protein
MSRGIKFVTACLCLTWLAGCGGGYSPDDGVIVTGKIVQGGQPVSVTPTPDGYNGVEVQLAGSGASTSVMCNADGSFEITYNEAGVPPGKYKLGVTIKQNEKDTLDGKLSGENMKIDVDVPQDKLGGKHDLGTIDIATHLQ